MRSPSRLVRILMPSLALIPSLAVADSVTIELDYPASALRITEAAGEAEVRLPGAELLARPGAPELPAVSEMIPLPAGTIARSVEVIDDVATRRSSLPVRPAQPPAILGPVGAPVPRLLRTAPDAAIYHGTEPYPAEIVTLAGGGRLGDLDLVALAVHPVQYDPVAGELIVHERLTVRVELAPAPSRTRAAGRQRELSRIANALLVGPGGVPEGTMQDARGAGGTGDADLGGDTPGQARSLDPDDIQYVIITPDAQRVPWEGYAAWKTAKGVPATVVTTTEIDAGYTGRDLPEKIRNFIIDAVTAWGTSYVLLAGDHPAVPARFAWAFDCEAGIYPDENDIPADLYYSDLDGSWDLNGNGIFGEVGDGVDLYPDVFVGRAPSADATQAQAIVNKFLTYERAPASGYTTRAFFFAEVLWNNPFTDAGIGKDMLADACFGPYEPVTRRYETLGNLSPASVVSTFNAGTHFTNHGGHANWTVLACGTGNLRISDIDALTNGPRYFVLYSIGCWSSAYDKDSVGEHFLINGNGGAIAYVGNSRYGWGSPGNPGWGYSETFDRDFYGALLDGGTGELGPAVAWPKIVRIPFSHSENVYRWHQYQVNLLGDPEMACHTGPISTLTIHAPAAIPTGATHFTAVVTDPAGPLPGARACLRGPDVYQMGFTDDLGRISFTPETASAQSLTLTITAADHVYDDVQIAATGDGGFLTVSGTTVDDDEVAPSAGNGDGEIGAGETFELLVTVENLGGSGCSQVTGTLLGMGPYVTIVTADAPFGDIGPGASVTNASPFVIGVSPDCPAGQGLSFTLLLEDASTASWSAALPLRVVAPGPCFHHYEATEIVGNGDGVIEPGETAAIDVCIANAGTGSLGPVTATLASSDPALVVTQAGASTAVTLPAGSLGYLGPSFEVTVDAACPATTYGRLELSLTHDEGSALDEFLMAVGSPGFGDDMESGVNGWTHYGTEDLWHQSTSRAHSGASSWYCGTADTHQYVNNMNAILMTPEFVAPESARLSFWCYYDVTVYGTDGISVEIFDVGGWRRVSYLGSGGALGTLFTCDWAPYVIDLDDLPAGWTTQVRFRMVTDGADVAEGFYIDDLTVDSPPAVAVDPWPAPTPAPDRFELIALTSQPVGPEARWRLLLPAPAAVRAGIYDAGGRLLRTLVDDRLRGGEHDIVWDGRAGRGSPAPAGVYLLRLDAGSESVTRKLIRLR